MQKNPLQRVLLEPSLDEVVLRAGLQDLGRGGAIGVLSREHHERNAGRRGMDLLDRGDTARARSVEVEQHDVDALAAEPAHGLIQSGHVGDFKKTGLPIGQTFAHHLDVLEAFAHEKDADPFE